MKTLYSGRMVKTCFSVVPESEIFITKNTLLPLYKCRDVCVMVVKSVSLIIVQLYSIRQYKVNFYPLVYFCKSHGMIRFQLTKQSFVWDSCYSKWFGSNWSKITADFPGFASHLVNFQNYFTHYQENKNKVTMVLVVEFLKNAPMTVNWLICKQLLVEEFMKYMLW